MLGNSMKSPHYFDPAPLAERHVTADLCIYGGTSGGVVAAREAAGRGMRVVLLEPSGRLGGLTAGGLSLTDLGRREYGRIVGGLAGQFYRDVGAAYGKEVEWFFEPHVAEEVFEAWIAAAGVRLFRNEFVDRADTAGTKIRALHTRSGLTVEARVFLDASYEGDLMARAGVSYRVGREANSVYGETFNGMQIRDNRFSHLVDPWMIEGKPGSGLLAGIELGDDYQPGTGDSRIQAYNFRLCLTKSPRLRIPFAQPKNFDPGSFELMRRYLRAGWKDVFGKFDPIRGDKVDMNNHGAVSTDFIGQNHDYPEASYEEREMIFQQHAAYQQGLMWWLANDRDVPEAIRAEMAQWGLCQDEFTGTEGWPHALYVRESRRMLAGLMMAEHHCLGASVAEAPIALAGHGMDSHTCRRVVRGNTLFNEGDVQVHPLKPYPISYQSIVPREEECSNLLVTFCLGATHIAFGSIRMEPVFMVLSQSAAVAAAMAVERDLAVQEVEYATLRRALDEAGQVLEWG